MKKILSTFFVFMMIMSLCVPCLAADTSVEISSIESPSGSLQARPETIARWNTEYDEALELATLEDELPVNATAAAGWYNISNFTYYGQEKSTSCGAAAVRMSLKALTGDDPTEEATREGCNWLSGVGTYMDNCCAYLNEAQSLYTYEDKYKVAKSLFTYNLYTAIKDDNAPPIVGIAITEDEGWFYDTTGHALTIYGSKRDRTAYKIADPWGGYADEPNWELYQKSADDLWYAYDSGQGYIC